jgi:hypothetical protein
MFALADRAAKAYPFLAARFAAPGLETIRWTDGAAETHDADSTQDVDGDVDGDGRRRDSIDGGRDE